MWILPVYGRPESLKRAIQNYPDAPINVIRTVGDPEWKAYEKITLPRAWEEFHAPRGSTVVQALNHFYNAHLNESFYGFLGDDVIPYGKEWWKTLGDLAGEWNVATPEDSIHGWALCPHFCLGGRLVRSVGYLAAPWSKHSFIDTVWYLIGKKLDLYKCSRGVYFEHLHPLSKTAAFDSTYAKGQASFIEDKAIFDIWTLQGALKALLGRLREEIR